MFQKTKHHEEQEYVLFGVLQGLLEALNGFLPQKQMPQEILLFVKIRHTQVFGL